MTRHGLRVHSRHDAISGRNFKKFRHRHRNQRRPGVAPPAKPATRSSTINVSTPAGHGRARVEDERDPGVL